jgi:hypothetical protein
MRLLKYLFITIGFLLLQATHAPAKVLSASYGLTSIGDSVTLNAGYHHFADSLLAPQFKNKPIVYGMEYPHTMPERTADFYLLIFLCLLLGLIRFSDPRYFVLLWRAFLNPTLSNRQLKDQLQGAGLSNLLMNIFFTMAGGAYIYCAVRLFTPQHTEVIPPSLLLLLLVAGMMVIYSVKYAAVRFSGWAFKVEGVTEHYLFNVFLINKILSIVLLPFIILLAFANAAWATPVMIVSLIAIFALLINRYIRSWQVFGSFFQYS